MSILIDHTERLKVENLRIESTSSGALIVDDVSFSVAAGEVCGLVGESGSGKTSISLSLLGYARRGLAVTRGSARIDGVDILAQTPSAIRAMRGAVVAYVPQDPSAALSPGMRVGRQLRETLRAHPGAWGGLGIDERITEVLADAGLADRAGIQDAYPHQLSGGQQQRVGIAMAFACAPAVIVLDEPTTGLDVTTQRHVLDTLRRLCAQSGTAAVYVSHDLAVTAELATKVLVLYAGRVVETGPTAAVFNRPDHPYTQGLLRAVPSSERAEVLQGIPGTPPRPDRRSSGCDFQIRCSFAVDEECGHAAPQLISIAGDREVRCVRIGEVLRRPPARVAVQDRSSSFDRRGEEQRLLRVSRLSAGYGDMTVLHDVSFDVSSGECLAVVGESGSGKTTLARCISGLTSSWTGEVSLDGVGLLHGVRGRSALVLQSVQYVFQNPYQALNPRKTIGELLAQPMKQFMPELGRSQRDLRISAALADVSLDGRVRDFMPAQLSGGERQRVAIARALAVEPRLLICDEVTSALDVSVQATTVELLRSLQAQREFALLFITHNLALVRSIAQSVLVLAQGRIMEYGTTTSVLERPQHEYTTRLLRDSPQLARVVEDDDDDVSELSVERETTAS